MTSRQEVIETTAGEVTAELKRRGVSPDERVTITLKLDVELIPGRREARARVVAVGLNDDDIDRLFHALADATRRDILVRAIEQEQSVSALASHYEMSFAAVQKHVAVLERAGLVVKYPRGREQLVRAEIQTVVAAQQLLEQFEALWRQRMDRFVEVLAQPDEGADPCP